MHEVIQRELDDDSVTVSEPLRPAHLVTRLALAATLAPFVVAAIVMLTGVPHAPIGDRALTQMRVDDVGHHTVLVGLYSRDGWAHPGPLLFYLLAGPYRLLGSSTAAMLTGALLLNAAAVAAMTAVARRLAGLPGALLVLVTAGVLVRALGPGYVSDPWVCSITVLPFGAFCLLVWALTSGQRWALPVSVGVASFLAQTHVGYVALCGPLLVGGAIWLFLHARRTHEVGAFARAALLSVLVAAVLWSPVLWDQLFRTGNLGKSFRWFRDARQGVHTVFDGVRVVLGQFGPAPGWVTGDRPVALITGETTLRSRLVAPVLLLPAAAALGIAIRRRDRTTLRLFAVLATGLTVGIVAVARTVGLLYEYRLQWTWVLAALTLFATLLGGWRALVARVPGAARALVGLGLAAIVALSGANTLAALGADDQSGWESPHLDRVADQVAATLDPTAGQVVLRSRSGYGTWNQQGLLLALERKGFDARVPADDGNAFGAHRVRSPGPSQAELLVLTDTDVSDYRPQPGWKVLAYSGDGPRDATVRAITGNVRRQRDLTEALRRGEIDSAEYERSRRALDRVTPHAVLVVATPR